LLGSLPLVIKGRARKRTGWEGRGGEEKGKEDGKGKVGKRE
jgi:hypothetical protein